MALPCCRVPTVPDGPVTPVMVAPGALAVALATALHGAGIPVGAERAGRFASALRLHPPVPPDARSRLYWTARTTLLSDRTQLPIFDAVFGTVFGASDDDELDPAESRGDQNAPPAIGAEPHHRPAPPDRRPRGGGAPDDQRAVTPPGGNGDGGTDGPQRDAVLAAASAEERLGHTAFAALDDDEIDAVRRLVRGIVLATPLRRTRRQRPTSHRAATIDLRATARAARRTGGDPVRLVHRRHKQRSRRLVLLCDVSGSMEPYTRVFLTLLQGAVTGARAEAFVFSTRLTRLTRPLSRHDPDLALAGAAAMASDWAGGTRLADSLRSFIDEHGRRGMARGAVVVILSDGWAQDDPAQVGEQMARLGRLAYRIVWVNPRKAAPGYAPLVGGMAAALPHCDAFVSGHSLAALHAVAAAIRAD
jgi:uncharacterized protein with von Willebrand factor type A (vWA) domain